MQVPNKYYRDEKLKHLIRGLFLVIVWSLIFSLWKGYLQTKKGFSRLDQVSKRMDEVQAEKATLTKKLELVKSDDYRRRLVREKLRLQKPDEIIVVMPEYNDTIGVKSEDNSKTNLEKWLEVFN